MLQLVLSQKSENKVDKKLVDEMDQNPSHQFIDDLIAQVKYAHLGEVWEARLKDLTESSSDSISHKFKKRRLQVI